MSHPLHHPPKVRELVGFVRLPYLAGPGPATITITQPYVYAGENTWLPDLLEWKVTATFSNLKEETLAELEALLLQHDKRSFIVFTNKEYPQLQGDVFLTRSTPVDSPGGRAQRISFTGLGKLRGIDVPALFAAGTTHPTVPPRFPVGKGLPKPAPAANKKTKSLATRLEKLQVELKKHEMALREEAEVYYQKLVDKYDERHPYPQLSVGLGTVARLLDEAQDELHQALTYRIPAVEALPKKQK